MVVIGYIIIWQDKKHYIYIIKLKMGTEIENAKKIYDDMDSRDKGHIFVSKTRLIGSNLAFIAGVFAMIGALYTGYGFIKHRGAKDAQIESLFDIENPVVKRLELTRGLNDVRKEYKLADTVTFLKVSADIKVIKASAKSQNEKLDFLIGLYKNNN